MNFYKKILCVLFSSIVLMSSSKVVASQGLDFAIDNMPRIVGVAIGFVPEYEGSDDYTFGAAPFVRFQLKGHYQYLIIRSTELQVNLIDHPWLRIGPSLNYRFGREDVDDSVVKKMKDIDDTIEAGGFVGVEFIDDMNPRKRFSADIDFLADIGSEHEGYTVTFGARGWYPVSRMFDIGLGAAFVYADDDYMETYFGVDTSDAARSGLPIFNADSGVKDFRIFPMAVMHINMNWHVGAGFQYRRLLADAEDSPIVDKRGSKNQWIGGIGVAYSW